MAQVIVSKHRKNKNFFPEIKEEIFVIDETNRTILNYAVICDFPEHSLINMLEGPTAAGVGEDENLDMYEGGFKS